MRLLPALIVLCACATAAPRPAQAKPKDGADSRGRILAAMGAELHRAQKQLKTGEHQPPYFISYTLRDSKSFDLQARYGAIYQDSTDHQRSIFVEVRVGDYELDNSGAEGGLFGGSSKATYISRKDAPLENDVDAIRASFWLATDEKYKQALSDYLRKRGDAVYQPDKEVAASFAKAPRAVYTQEPLAHRYDPERWRREVRRASRRLKRSRHIFDNLVHFTTEKEIRFFVNTEKTRVVTEEVLFALHVNVVGRAEDGMLLNHSRSFYGRLESDLPRGKVLDAELDRLQEEFLALRKALVMDPFTGPAILSPEATGVLFHEAIGHRLEGERQDDEESGRTFKGQVGRAVTPSFLSVYDDPTMVQWGTTKLNGHYLYDDEGVKAQRASLIEAGVLVGYIKSRTPVKDAPPASNGHGRSQGTRDPVARMATLVVAATTGDPAVVSRAQLKEKLVAEAKKQGRKYGLIVADIAGGATNTSSYGYQAFRGVPTLMYRVDVTTGEEVLVRGVEIVGTPLTVINNIVAASHETGVFNGFCGAESGYVPVSTVAPATLIRELELQRSRPQSGRDPILDPPWATGEPGRAIRPR